MAPTFQSGGNMIPFEISHLDHVVLRVQDMQQSLDFYTTVLGCHVVKRREEACREFSGRPAFVPRSGARTAGPGG